MLCQGVAWRWTRALLATAVVAGACTRGEVAHPAPAARATPAPPPPPPPTAAAPIAWDRDLAFLPVDSEVVIGLDLAQLRRSPLWDQHAGTMLAKIEGPLDAIRAACGFDPVATLTGASFGGADLGGAPRGVIVLHGLSRAVVTACVEKHEHQLAATVDGGVALFATHDGQIAATFVDDTTLVAVMGPAATKQGIKTVLAGQSALPTSPVFLGLWKLIDHTSSGWLLWNGSSQALATIRSVAPELRVIFGSVRVTDELALDGRVRMNTPAAAATLVQLLTPQVSQARAMFRRFDLTADDVDVHIELQLDADQLANIAAMLHVPPVQRDAKGH